MGTYLAPIETKFCWQETVISRLTAPPGQAPLYHWKMNDNAASTVVVDTIGTANGVASANTSTLTAAGKINTSLNLSGGKSISLTYANIGTTLSYVGWINGAAASACNVISFMQTLVRVSTTVITWWANTGSASVNSNAISIDNGWHHIAITQTGTTYNIYLDAVNVGTGTCAAVGTANAGTAGIGSYAGTANWGGAVDDFRIYNAALSLAQIQTLYNSGSGTETTTITTATKGYRYLVIATATGDWAGKEKYIAYYDGSAYQYILARAGMVIWSVADSLFYYYSGSAWAILTPSMVGLGNVTNVAQANKALDNLASVAINTSLISDTDVTDDLGSAAKQWRKVYTPAIAFPATQTADAGANVLDDYEEGTWTAAFAAGTSGTITIDTGQKTGKYVKIGRQVTLTGVFHTTAISSPVGLLTITGLPFVSYAANANGAAVAFQQNGLAVTAITSIVGSVEVGGSTIRIYRYAAGAAANAAADMTNDSYITIGVTYFIE